MKKFLRPTWAEIDLGAFRHNFRRIKNRIGAKADILAMVKADAYGHGVLELSKASLELGAKILGVALIEEGIFLRKKGIRAPILVMGSIFPLENFKPVLEYGLYPSICSIMAAEKLSAITLSKKKKAGVFVKIDTGMGRVGISHNRAAETIKKISKLPGISIEGLFTHLAAGAIDAKFTRWQIKRFKEIVDILGENGVSVKYRSVSNSTGIIKYPEAHFNLVRPGIALYGLLPYAGADRDIKLVPVLSWKTRVVFLKKVNRGTSISYSRTWKAKRASCIATLPVGYADGYDRKLSNRAEVLVNGKRAPVVGNVCMDMCMIDVTDVGGVKVGSEVVLIGSQEKQRITAEEMAGTIGTINYEVTCRLGTRVPRIFNNNSTEP